MAIKKGVVTFKVAFEVEAADKTMLPELVQIAKEQILDAIKAPKRVSVEGAKVRILEAE